MKKLVPHPNKYFADPEYYLFHVDLDWTQDNLKDLSNSKGTYIC